jgi:hypothetical protein
VSDWALRPANGAGKFADAADLERVYDQIQELTDPNWTAYTPVWTAAVGSPSLGNGVLSGRYRRSTDSDMVIYEGKLLVGSTTSVAGTTQWLFSVPLTPSADAVIFTTGAVFILDTGTTTRIGVVRFNSSTHVTFETASGGFTSASPQAWANGDYFTFTIMYEVA